jgi:DNA primase large subunit
MNMKRIICIISLLLFTASLHAQPGKRGSIRDARDRRTERPGSPGQRAERIQAIKVGYLTDRLQLSASQAATFWPVYNEYERELREARKAFRQKYGDGGANESDAEAGRFIEDNLDFQEQAIDIKRKYKDRFLKIISAQQLASLYEAERDFKKLLLEQLRQRRGRQ